MFDINNFKEKTSKKSRYPRRLNQLKENEIYSNSIEVAVEGAINNIKRQSSRSFVIYGEPQSGKTELMIALTAKLLDEGHRIIVVLLNDNVQLLNQNLDRFRRSGLDPTPKNYAEVLDPAINIKSNEWVIFCKKNSKDLQKLINKLNIHDIIVILDDEADYATPNSKVNKGERTRINELVGELLSSNGIYIGVTATPARLDLNNTFENDNDCWIDFPPHPSYTGQDLFFPISSLDLKNLEYQLKLLPDKGDDPKYLRQAIFRFLVNVSYLNTEINKDDECYSMLIHTSGKKADHTEDYKVIIHTLNALKDESNKHFDKYVEDIWNIANSRYPSKADYITQYILENRNRNTIIVMNSDIDKKVVDFTSATSPSTLFTFAIGGNIVSRGVTFDNLLSMFFTRDVKHKIQQDTYIQRARMFGVRGKYIKYFELSIPDHLYFDWHKCFIFHKLALESIRNGNGSPVWLEDQRISVAASSSIDKTTVAVDSGEMSYELFDYTEDVNRIINSDELAFSKLSALHNLLGDKKLPPYVIDYIKNFSPRKDDSIAIHLSSSIEGYKDISVDKDKIERRKGFMGKTQLQQLKYPHAVHHIKVFYNGNNKARVFYKYDANIKFLKNQGKFKHD